MQDFRKLDIYKKAIEYCSNIYKFLTKLPDSERYGLISQIRRAGVSIALNISEGAGCSSNKEFLLFINYAYRSCNEVSACLELIEKLHFYKNKDEIKILEKEGSGISRMIYSFSKKLKTSN